MKQDLKSHLNKNYIEVRGCKYYYIIIDIIISIFICDNCVVQHDILITWGQILHTLIGIQCLGFAIRFVATNDLFALLYAVICLDLSKPSSQLFTYPINRQSFVYSYLLYFHV